MPAIHVWSFNHSRQVVPTAQERAIHIWMRPIISSYVEIATGCIEMNRRQIKLHRAEWINRLVLSMSVHNLSCRRRRGLQKPLSLWEDYGTTLSSVLAGNVTKRMLRRDVVVRCATIVTRKRRPTSKLRSIKNRECIGLHHLKHNISVCETYSK